MKIDLTVDGKFLSLSLSSDKPLSLLLREDIEVYSLSSNCNGNLCGNCIVLLDGRAVLSCLIPAFEVRNRTVITFDGFSRTRDFRDIERALQSEDVHFCPRCQASQVLLIESIVRRFEGGSSELDEAEILQEASLVKCDCSDSKTFLNVTKKALENRRKRRNVRRA